MLGLLLFLFGHSCFGNIDDTRILTSLIDSIHDGLPDDWSLTKLSIYCHWTGVTCQSYQDEYFLSAINLTDYKLFGQLPLSGWKKATHLMTLVFSYNNLYGNIPYELFDIFRGKIFLDHNDFTGNLPDIPPSGTSITFFHVQSNKLTGCIPQSYKQVTTFSKGLHQGLRLENNYFNCTDTSCMNNLPDFVQSACPPICEDGKYCWNIPPTIVLMITLMGGGFVFGSLAMFFASKFLYHDGFHEGPLAPKRRKYQDLDQTLINTNTQTL